jgi:hypothetical protein
MAYKTNLTRETEQLVAYHTIKRGFDVMAKRADRKVKPLALSVYDRLTKKQKFSKGSIVTADYRFLEQEKARTLTEGIKEFSQRFPEYGKTLKGIIKETRTTKKRYLEFGINPGYEIADLTYIAALEDIGIKEENLSRTFETVMDISDLLKGKREEGINEMLIK